MHTDSVEFTSQFLRLMGIYHKGGEAHTQDTPRLPRKWWK